MPYYGSQSVRGCSAELQLRYGQGAELHVARQVKWARERGKDDEIAYWEAVLDDLAKLPSRR
jgi:hypothetical protein